MQRGRNGAGLRLTSFYEMIISVSSGSRISGYCGVISAAASHIFFYLQVFKLGQEELKDVERKIKRI